MKRHTKKYLIINADDFNLTPGISRAILYGAERGVISSTSVFVTGGGTGFLKALKKVRSLGVGLHFNITAGRPVSRPNAVKTLVMSDGKFIPRSQQRFNQIKSDDVLKELESQIKKFVTFFGCLPTHIDSHHHVHCYKKIYTAVCAIAQHYNVPIRKRYLKTKNPNGKGTLTTDYIYGRFNPDRHWTTRSLLHVLHGLKNGVSELIVHPGYTSPLLTKKSSFNRQREKELDALCSNDFIHGLRKKAIALIRFNDLQWIKRNH